MKRLVGMGLVLALHLGCGAFQDPAVRLAYGLEHGVKEHPRDSGPLTFTCELDVPSGCLVLLHPEGELSDEQLLAAGLPPSRLAEFRALRLGPWPSIYVLPNDPKQLCSRTTYQRNFVRIPKAFIATRSTDAPLRVTVAGPPEDRYIESIE